MAPNFAALGAPIRRDHCILAGHTFIILTGGKGEVGLGVAIAGKAYSALIEGSLGIAINDQLSANDLAAARSFLSALQAVPDSPYSTLTYRDLRNIQRMIGRVEQDGDEAARRYLAVYDTYTARYEAAYGESLTEEALEELVSRLTSIERLMPAHIQELRLLLEGDAVAPGFGWQLDAELLSNREARRLVDAFVAFPGLRAELVARVEGLAAQSDEELRAAAQTNLAEGGTLLAALADMGEEAAREWLEEFVAAAEAAIELPNLIPASAITSARNCSPRCKPLPLKMY